MPQTHLKRHSGDAKISVTAGFTPGGHIPSGYSYLQRSHSLVTPSRKNIPQGMSSPTRLQKDSNSNSPLSSPTSPIQMQHCDHATPLTDIDPSLSNSKANTDGHSISDLVTQLPPNPKIWTPSQVALYLTHVLKLTPKPVVEDVTAYVRQSRMGGKIFLRLREKDLEAEGLNLKWRTLMIEAVKKLRRDCLRGRIWGFEGGLELPRQADELLTDDHFGNEDTEQKPHITAQGTLKRLRDKKGIRQMISGFENPSPKRLEDERGFATLKGDTHGSQTSLSSLVSVHQGDKELCDLRSPMAPIYGPGFVKSRADSYTSLNDSSTQFRQKEFTKEELEQLFGSLSDEEAEAIANELLQDEELVMEISAHNDQYPHHRSMSSLLSSSSSDVDLVTPPSTEEIIPVHADEKEAPLPEENGLFSLQIALPTDEALDINCIDPAEIGNCANEVTALGPSTLSRPMSDERYSPYRSSTYGLEDMEALGMTTVLKEENKFSTAKRRQCSPFMATSILIETTSTDCGSSAPSNVAGKALPSALPSDLYVEAAPLHMRNMSAHEASGLSPYKPISQPMSRRSSQKRHGDAKEKERNAGTVSRGGEGINGMQLTAMLMASGLADGPFDETDGAEDTRKAENESAWGITFSRKASRRGTLARLADQDKETGAAAASRMAELFTPSDNQIYGMNEDVKVEVSETGKQLQIPAEHAKEGSMRKRSMILVERKKFESLARRMGLLESQLADMASAALPPLSDLHTSDVNKLNQHQTKESSASALIDFDDVESSTNGLEERATNRGWNIARLLSGLPSYALGLGAGVGFVLFNELLGKSRR